MEETFVDGLRDRGTRGYRVRSYIGVAITAIREWVSPSSSEVGGGNRRGEMRANVLGSVSQDVRFALRSLRRQPAFAAVAIATLALGIGANVAIFSVIKGVLLNPLPFRDPDRLVVVWSHDLDSPEGRGWMSRENIEDIADLPAFTSLVGFSPTSATLTGRGEPQVVAMMRVSEGILSTFGLRPLLGRDLTREENDPNAPRVVVVSHGFWRDQLGERPDVIGSSIEISEEQWEIVGVAPAGFDFEDGAMVWRPTRQDSEGCARGCSIYRSVGRLAPGATVEGATAEMNTLAEALAAEYPQSNFDTRFRGLPLRDEVVGDFKTGLLLVFGTVSVVLLIACANVAILLLVRASAREGEMAVRAALGAGRFRIMRQMLIESQVLAFAGAALGLVLAVGAISLVKTLSAGTIPRIEAVTLDGSVLAFTLGTAVTVAILFGLAPALSLGSSSIARGLIAGGRRGSAGTGHHRLRAILLAGEVALSLVLLTGCGLLLKTFQKMYSVDLGYRTTEITRFTLSLPSARYETLEQVSAFYSELEREIRSIPGVASVGSVFGPPLGSGNISGEVLIEGQPEPAPGQETYASIKPITPGYLETMEMALLRGRGIEPTDGAGAVPVALVNEAFVGENFPIEEPLGQLVRVTASFGYAEPVFTIVGVVRDIRSRSLTNDASAEIYVSHAQFGPGFMTTAVRGRESAPPLLPALRERVHKLDPNVPLRGVETMTEAVQRQLATTRFYLVLIAVFSGLAITLAAVGLYGVASYLAQTREREIGIRMALGAGAGPILGLVMVQGMRPALVGIGIGVAGSAFAARLIEGLLYNVAPRDPSVLAAVAGVLLFVAVLASVLPALRATGVNPVQVMRAE